MKTIQVLLLFILAVLGLNTTAQAQEPRFTAGQTFNLRIAGVPLADLQQVSGTYTISSNGVIRLPYLPNDITAVGLSPSELQRKLESAYKAGEIYTHPTINITTNATMTSDMVITVGGEVRQPGDVPYRPGVNLYSAISKCGGPTEYGDMKRVKLLRGKTEKVIDLRKVGKDNNPELEAGDQIVVPGS
jgi:protein involved in polysaccharide export with SLBB domain